MNAREALLEVYQRRRVLTAPVVVEEARPAGSPLHDHFEWNDAKAGDRYRLIQAQELIRKFRVTYTHDQDGASRSVREWVSVERPGVGRSYVPTEEAVVDPFTRELLKRECLREAAAFRAKYEALDEYADIVTGLLAKAS